jgi:hypothetical protein
MAVYVTWSLFKWKSCTSFSEQCSRSRSNISQRILRRTSYFHTKRWLVSSKNLFSCYLNRGTTAFWTFSPDLIRYSSLSLTVCGGGENVLVSGWWVLRRWLSIFPTVECRCPGRAGCVRTWRRHAARWHLASTCRDVFSWWQCKRLNGLMALSRFLNECSDKFFVLFG